MSIFRTRKRENPFVQIDKTVIEDDSISFQAKGIMVYLLSKPDDWKILMVDLEKRGTNGRESIRSAVKELCAAGYMVRVKARDESTGRMDGWQYDVFERPTDGFPSDGKPTVGNPSTTNNRLSNNILTNITPTPSGQDGGGGGQDTFPDGKMSPVGDAVAEQPTYTLREKYNLPADGANETDSQQALSLQDQAEIIYRIYPNKKKPIKAKEAIIKALRHIPFEKLKERTERYAEITSMWFPHKKKYIPHTASWYNSGAYDEDEDGWMENCMADPDLLRQIVETYNKHAVSRDLNWWPATEKTEARVELLSKLIREGRNLDWFEDIWRRCAENQFLRGKAGGIRFFHLTWIFEGDHLAKLVEGAYGK